MKKHLIIVAGGSGKRMNIEKPKQFALLNNIPVLMHTIKKFHDFDSKINSVVVLPEQHLDEWKMLCRKYAFHIPHRTTGGGSTRFHSVKEGLGQIFDEDGYVAIHDGVRPFVSNSTITCCFDAAAVYKSAIPVVTPPDSLRIIEGGESKTIDRNHVRIIQTPQVFELNMLRKAYEQPYQDLFTDDATVVEAAGNKIFLTDGNRENIKITHPEDWLLAESIMKEQNNKRNT